MAFAQPPEYQPQSTPAAFSRSPMVGFVCAGSFAPKRPDGWNAGCCVLTLKSPQASHVTGQHVLVDGGYVHLDRALT